MSANGKGWNSKASAAQHEVLSIAARAGFSARGAIYLIAAAFIAAAAMRSGQQAHGVIDALQAIADVSAGKVVLLILAVGLACFAG